MDSAEETRRRRFAHLVERHGGVAKLAILIGRSSSQVSQWLNASIDHKSHKPRSISAASARRIEEVLGYPAGWMDQPLPSEDNPVGDGSFVKDRAVLTVDDAVGIIDVVLDKIGADWTTLGLRRAAVVTCLQARREGEAENGEAASQPVELADAQAESQDAVIAQYSGVDPADA